MATETTYFALNGKQNSYVCVIPELSAATIGAWQFQPIRYYRGKRFGYDLRLRESAVARHQRSPNLLRTYLVNLKPGKIALWCYLIWYLVLASKYFDPSPAIWLNAVGISTVIGTSLWLGIRSPGRKPDSRWQVFRLFLTPFCVSSFSALIKGKGFILVFPPRLAEFSLAAGVCASFAIVVNLLKIVWRPKYLTPSVSSTVDK
jgi:hypothetical protein